MNQFIFLQRNLADKMAKIIKDWRLIHFYLRTYIFTLFNTNRPSVYIVSYPKCGRTWLRMMLVKYFSEINRLNSIDFLMLEHLGDNRNILFVHDCSTWVPIPQKVTRLKIKYKKYSDKKIIFLVRDPRDVLLSSWNHLKYRENIYKFDLSTFIHDPYVGIEKVIAFMNLWIENRNMFNQFLLIQYEELKIDIVTTLTKVLEFLGEDSIDYATLKRAIEFASHENMKRMESSGDYHIPWLKPGNTKDPRSYKTRKGIVGDWKNQFSIEDINFMNLKIKEQLNPAFHYSDDFTDEDKKNSIC